MLDTAPVEEIREVLETRVRAMAGAGGSGDVSAIVDGINELARRAEPAALARLPELVGFKTIHRALNTVAQETRARGGPEIHDAQRADAILSDWWESNGIDPAAMVQFIRQHTVDRDDAATMSVALQIGIVLEREILRPRRRGEAHRAGA